MAWEVEDYNYSRKYGEAKTGAAYVYCFYSPHEKLFKIGVSVRPELRANTFGVCFSSPYMLWQIGEKCLFWAFAYSVPEYIKYKCERQVHLILSSKRKHKEWFDLGGCNYKKIKSKIKQELSDYIKKEGY